MFKRQNLLNLLIAVVCANIVLYIITLWVNEKYGYMIANGVKAPLIEVREGSGDTYYYNYYFIDTIDISHKKVYASHNFNSKGRDSEYDNFHGNFVYYEKGNPGNYITPPFTRNFWQSYPINILIITLILHTLLVFFTNLYDRKKKSKTHV